MTQKTAAAPLPVLDITQPLTAAAYRHCLGLMWPAMEAVARSRNWCGRWYEHARVINATFPRYPSYSGYALDYNADAYVWPVPREDLLESAAARYEAAEGEHYRKLLDNSRRLILREAARGNITLEEANGVFAACGLPAYDADSAVSRWHISFPDLDVIAPGAMTSAHLRDAFTALTEKVMTEHLPPGVTATPGMSFTTIPSFQTTVIAPEDYTVTP
jgi:hypothetical protein